MKTPWVALYCHSFIQSKSWLRMNAEQQAIYFNLLLTQAVSGPLPADLEDLAFLATRNTRGLSEERFMDLWDPLISGCFEEVDGSLVNPKMAEELEVANKRTSKSRHASQVRWENSRKAKEHARALPEQSSTNAMTGHDMTEQNRTETPSESPPKPPKGKRAASALIEAAMGPLVEPWLAEVCESYAANRAELKAKALGKRGWVAVVKKLRPLGEASARACVDLSASNGWIGLFPEKIAPAASQAPSAGSYYKGPKLKDVEARTRRNEIWGRMEALTQNYMLPEEEALQLARDRGDRAVHMLDWMNGLRNDPTPSNPIICEDISHE